MWNQPWSAEYVVLIGYELILKVIAAKSTQHLTPTVIKNIYLFQKEYKRCLPENT
jgi:hypothetical protein